MQQMISSLKPRPGKNRESNGFTLIELLTVIAIIGILASILIPVVGAVRARAHAAKCINNIRQSAMAILQYTADDGSILIHWGGSGGGRNLWSDRLIDGGYLDADARSVVFCPTAPPLTNLLDRVEANPWATYGFNMLGDAGTRVSGENTSLYQLSIDRVEDPTRYFLLADSGIPTTQYQRMRISSYDANTLDGIHARHGGKANMAFADGHVEGMSPEDLARLGFRSYFDENWQIVSLPSYD